MDNNLFHGKYRIPSARLQNWDYRSSAPYFVTICTHKMQHLFGYVENKEMYLNELGTYTKECIDNLQIYCTSETIDASANDNDDSIPLSSKTPYVIIVNQIVMPNHLHILLELKNHTNEHQPNRFGPLLKKSLSSVLNHFKGRITKFAKNMDIPKVWHPRFHDHVVRDMIEYQRIFNYISNNPANWKGDKFNNGNK